MNNSANHITAFFAPADSPLPSPLFAPFGFSVGDQFVPPGDDISEGPVLLKQPFRFFGKSETEAYVCLDFISVVKLYLRINVCHM